MDIQTPQIVIPALTLPLTEVLSALACLFVAYLCYRQWRKMNPRRRRAFVDLRELCHCGRRLAVDRGCACGC